MNRLSLVLCGLALVVSGCSDSGGVSAAPVDAPSETDADGGVDGVPDPDSAPADLPPGDGNTDAVSVETTETTETTGSSCVVGPGRAGPSTTDSPWFVDISEESWIRAGNVIHGSPIAVPINGTTRTGVDGSVEVISSDPESMPAVMGSAMMSTEMSAPAIRV